MIYTREYVETVLRGYAEKHPDRVNPIHPPDGMSDEASPMTTGCAYDLNGEHCIAGQFLVDEDLVQYLPDGDFDQWEGSGVQEIITYLDQNAPDVEFTQDATNLLALVQEKADNAINGDGTDMPRPWGEAITLALDES